MKEVCGFLVTKKDIAKVIHHKITETFEDFQLKLNFVIFRQSTSILAQSFCD